MDATPRPTPAPGASTPDGMIQVKKLSDIDGVLDAMWRAASENEASQGEPPPVRVCLGNVIAVTDRVRSPKVAEDLDRLILRRPARIVVVEIDPQPTPGGFEAFVRAVCHRPTPERSQVCCEQIHLRAGVDDLHLLTGVIVPLIEPDLPSLLWWDRTWEGSGAILDRLLGEVGALLYDFEQVEDLREFRTLKGMLRGTAVHDLAWTRIEPWRREMARVFDDPAMIAHLGAVDRLSLTAGDTLLGRPPASALLFAGWLASRLGWEISGPLRAEGQESRTTAVGPGGEIEIVFARHPGEGSAVDIETLARHVLLHSVRLGAGDAAEVALTRADSADMISVEVSVPGDCPPPRLAKAPAATPDEIIGHTQESRGSADPVYENALGAALELAGVQ